MKRGATFVTAVALVAFVSFGSHGCATKKQTGALVGAGAGAAAGALIGKAAGNTAVGAILGAAIGGAAGAVIGNYMDRQAEEMERDLEGARIERVGEGIKVTFDSGILFDVDKADLQSEAKTNLVKLAGILNKYEDTNILIEGHTDSTGPEEYNMGLSKRRADAVAAHLATQNVASNRFSIMGYGEVQPIATNETVDGRRLNRRVELAIMANDKLKEAAKRQAREG